MKTKLPTTSPSGAYIEYGPREYQLYANVPKSDALVAVLEIDTDCHGRVFHYFMRGGITESALSHEELMNGLDASADLLRIAKTLWPRKLGIGHLETSASQQ